MLYLFVLSSETNRYKPLCQTDRFILNLSISLRTDDFFLNKYKILINENIPRLKKSNIFTQK